MSIRAAYRASRAREREAARERQRMTEYGVFEWHPSPIYRREEAVKVYQREAAATKFAAANNLVVRSLTRESS